MSALEKLGSSLAEAMKKIVRAPVVDENSFILLLTYLI